MMSLAARLKRILEMRCDEAAMMTSQQCDDPLPIIERLALASHLLLCRPCRRLRRQFQFLRAAMHSLAARAEDSAEALSADARLRIEAALRNEASE